MKPIYRNPEEFAVNELFTSVGRQIDLSLADSKATASHLARLLPRVDKMRANPIAVHGHRAEAMFGYLAAALGQADLIRREDGGHAFIGVEARAPDYRVVLTTGTEFLVEVKNCHRGNPAGMMTLTESYLNKLRQYASKARHPLKLAIYWSRWRLWTLVPVEALRPASAGKRGVSLLNAMMANEMADLGDILLATTPPLRFLVVTDPTKPRVIDPNGQIVFTIGDVRIFAGSIEIKQPSERRLAMYMLMHGSWEELPPAPRIEEGQLISIEFVSQPAEHQLGQESAIVGHLSTMISDCYNDHTTVDGVVHHLTPPVDPKELASAIPGKAGDLQLPLWIFHVRPSIQVPHNPCTQPPVVQV